MPTRTNLTGGGFFRGFFPQRRARLEQQAAQAERSSVIEGLDFGVDELVRSTADPEDAAAWQDRWNSAKRSAMSSDPELQKQGITELYSMGSEVRTAMDGLREDRKSFVSEALRDQRDRYTKATAQLRTVNASAGQFAALINDPGFDPKNPINAGQLLKLLNSGPRQVFDPEDMGDALAAVGGQGLFGGLVQLLAGTMKAEDFNVSKDQWRQLAAAAYRYTAQPYTDELERIGASAEQLKGVADHLGMFPPGYDAVKFVTEQRQDFAQPALGPRHDAAPSDELKPAVQESARDFLSYVMTPQPGSSVARADARGQDGVPYVGPAPLAGDPGAPANPQGLVNNLASWYDRAADMDLEPYRQRGAKIMIDPATGDAFARYDDGREEPIRLPALSRFALRRRLSK